VFSAEKVFSLLSTAVFNYHFLGIQLIPAAFVFSPRLRASA